VGAASSVAAHSESPSDILSESLGRIDIDADEAKYDESTHWTAILDGIDELKEYADNQVEPEPMRRTIANPQRTWKPTLLCPTEHAISEQEILAAIPPKAVVDRLIAKCFMHAEILHIILHAPTFQKQYEGFWKQPQSTPIMWIGILYGLLCVGSHYELFAIPVTEQNPTPTLPLETQVRVEIYRRKMIECMVLGGYSKGVPHTIETMQLYLQVEYLAGADSPTEFWLLLGMLMRLAYRMGYHRDGSQFPNITPFEAEMRRRRWCSIMQMETMLATQFGLPRMIKEAQTDVAPPHNLFDEDFDESTTKLPESRPVTSVTPSLYLITKTGIFSILGRISELTSQTVQAPYTDVLKLDKVLDDYYENVPPCFKMRSMTQSIIDKPELIFQRVWIATLYFKSKCVLHRPYLRVGRVEKRCAYSRNACIDSALQVLQLQKLLHEESLPNGRLFQDRWRLSSLIKQDYLLATAILCVDVYTDLELEMSPADRKYPVDKQSRYRILDALRTAISIWEQESGGSQEAKKATSVLQLVLAKAGNVEATQQSSSEASSSMSPNSYEAESLAYGKVYDTFRYYFNSNVRLFGNRPGFFGLPNARGRSRVGLGASLFSDAAASG
jgi:hypothetical protein